MPYDDPNLKEFDSYYQARSASKRERAENWAVAIGLQKVDGLTPSRYLIDLEPLERFFRNLIMGERNELKNRYLLVGISDEERTALGKGLEGSTKKRSEKAARRPLTDCWRSLHRIRTLHRPAWSQRLA